MNRFTSKQAELAAKISNDISEGIDCRESRKALRMAIAYFADMACSEAQRRAELEAKLGIINCAKKLMDAVLETTSPSPPLASSGSPIP